MTEKDTLISQSEGNRFIGFRVSLLHSDRVNAHTGADVEGKISNEYNSGYINAHHTSTIATKWNFFIKNRFEATHYHQDKELRFIDNKTKAGVSFKIKPEMSIELQNEFQLRNYEIESQFFNSFLQNELGLRLSSKMIQSVKTDFIYSYRDRQYDSSPAIDYSEHIVELNIWPGLSSSINILGRLQGRFRDYQHGFVDSLFTNNFNELYTQWTVQHRLSKHFGLGIDCSIESREYEYFSTANPVYLEYLLEPIVSFGLGYSWSIRLGYRYRNRHHWNKEWSTTSAEIENFFSHGPTLSLDIFSNNGFIANISNTFEIRRFPNSQADDGSGLSLYSNRNINTLFLFLSCNLSSHWTVTVMSNLDYDNDRDLDGSDSRYNLVNIELSYKF